ncbi:CHAP domain-containing protein [Microtetraspora sp. AC03309]|uniref:CHAP domain-containing protein n=1 Tax=Microtetraspora sp. AC03309 TaxID=2779376 RepID=UPI001E31B09B|nr:CHAP domain-containing protein [Microtetraspora sp. AC03309]MCC5578687.1 CHAP domain-containing protein [Microtetraspora sp. AC03309]
MTKLLELLRSQVGYSAKSNGYTKFGNWYNNVEKDSDYSDQPWCDMFLSWGARQLGYDEWFGQFAWTVGHARWFKEHGAWGGKPVPGALVFYDWSGSGTIAGIDHVGIVTKVIGNKIQTIEGNIDGGRVSVKVRDKGAVVGYGYPEKVKERLKARAETISATKASVRELTPAAPYEVGPQAIIASVLLTTLALTVMRARRRVTVRLKDARASSWSDM